MTGTFRSSCALALALAAATAQAQPQPGSTESTAHRHLGFALRLDGGVGYMNSSEGALTVKGGGGEFGVLVGGAVREDLIIGGHLWAFASVAPDLQENGATTSTNNDTTNSLAGLGVNITYYVMPTNLYLSATPSVTGVTLKQNGLSHSSDAGFGMQLAVGKEWWVGSHWGIGLAGQFMFSTNQDKGGGPSFTSTAGALVFSATYN